MSTFERYLTLWVALCILAGIALGHVMPGVFQVIGSPQDMATAMSIPGGVVSSVTSTRTDATAYMTGSICAVSTKIR